MTYFTGFPVAALDFYDDLELDKTRSFWEAHRQVYADAVKAPFAALAEALEPEFGAVKVFRPYRDVRFAKDNCPVASLGIVCHCLSVRRTWPNGPGP